LFKNHPAHYGRSAGTSDKARIKVNQKLLDWAYIVFVMERKHKAILTLQFPAIIAAKKVIALEIPDNYQFGDPELVELLKDSLSDYL